MPIKIAMIGAGSIGFTRRLLRDILAVPELADTTFAMMDLSAHNLEMVEQLCLRDVRANNIPATIATTTTRPGETGSGTAPPSPRSLPLPGEGLPKLARVYLIRSDNGVCLLHLTELDQVICLPGISD